MTSLLCALLLAAVPQEGTATREEIARELEAKFAALGPIFARAVIETEDYGAPRKARTEIEIHFQPADMWMYSVQRDLLIDDKEKFVLYEKDDTHLSWSPGKDGAKVDNAAYYKWFWKSQFELDSELAKILAIPGEAKSLGSFKAGVKPQLEFDLRSDSVHQARSQPRIMMDRAREGGASWFEMLRWASSGDIVVTADEVVARFPGACHETVIDRKTGFLKSVTNCFTTGDRRFLVVKELKTGVKKPEVKKPGKTKTTKPGSDDLANGYSNFLYGYLHENLEKIVKHWDVAGTPAKGEALRGFFTIVAARREALLRDAWSRRWAEGWVRVERKRGRSLEEMVRDFDKSVQAVKEYIESGDEAYYEALTERAAQFRSSLKKRMADVATTADMKSVFAKRIDESFERFRIDKELQKLPPPDYRDMLRDAIEEARRNP
jgi:hypothetical protein